VPSTNTAIRTRPASTVARPRWALVRALAAVGILGLLVWWVGSGPFLDGVRAVNGWSLAAALGIGVATIVCCAWRWTLVAAGLGVRLRMRDAFAAYYRSQFLNTTLPGGVVGDVHRALRYGLDIGNVGRGVRAVVLERVAGQAALAAIALVVLSVFPSPVRSDLPVAIVVVVGIGVGFLALWALVRGRSWRWAHVLRTEWAQLRTGLLARRTVVGIMCASAVVVAGHLATFLLAARTAGSTAPLRVLLPLVVLALLAMSLPLNLAGWGPREGVAAWVFGAAGLTAAQGVATAVTYGVLVLAASLPGAAVLVVRWARSSAVPVAENGSSEVPVPVGRHGDASG
jgi:glycosyltransferase 2 family protein